jgi:hypothetical protein
VKLLFDQNVSPDLIRRLHDLFPGSEHVWHERECRGAHER